MSGYYWGMQVQTAGCSVTSSLAAVTRHAARVRETIRVARSRTTTKQDDEYVRNVAKACLSSERSHAIEHIVALVTDVARRGTGLEEAEAIGHELVAIARAEYAATHPDVSRPNLSRDEAALAEQAAQGERENEEKAMDLFPTVTNRLRFLAASAKYARAAQQLDEAVRREMAQERTLCERGS